MIGAFMAMSAGRPECYVGNDTGMLSVAGTVTRESVVGEPTKDASAQAESGG